MIRPFATRQRGAFSIITAAVLLTSLSALMLAVDSSRLFLQQRELQNIADIAALEAISQLPDGQCYKDAAQAQQISTVSAVANGLPKQSGTVKAQCAHVTYTDHRSQVNPDSKGPAVQVTVSNKVPTSLILQVRDALSAKDGTTTLTAVATAERSIPTAAFSVGAELLNLEQNSILGYLLKGVGLNVEHLSVLNSKGLANATITPSGLLNALGIKVNVQNLSALTPEGLLDLNVKVGALGIKRLLEASANLVNDKTLSLGLTALYADLIGSNSDSERLDIIKNANINLFHIPGVTERGLISIAANNPDLKSALDTQINLGPLLNAAILLGTADARGIQIPSLSSNLLGVEVKAGIVEPASIGIGPVGTTARNAQIRIGISARTASIPVLGTLLNILGTEVNLPIQLDLASATGELTELSCKANAGSIPSATIAVKSEVGALCMGKPRFREEHIGLGGDMIWSTSESCYDTIEPDTFLQALGIPLLRGQVALRILKNDTHDSATIEDITGTKPSDEERFRQKALVFPLDVLPCDPSDANSACTQLTEPNPLLLGTLVKDLTDQVIGLIGGGLSERTAFNNDEATRIAKKYLDQEKLHPSKSDHYTISDLRAIRKAMQDDGLDWTRPGLLGITDSKMSQIWYLRSLAFYRKKNSPNTVDDPSQAKPNPERPEDEVPLDSSVDSSLYGCYVANKIGYDKDCVEENLIRSLQTNEAGGVLTKITEPLLSKVVQPLLAVVLEPIAQLLKLILDGLGAYILSPLLQATGVNIGQTEVTLLNVNCGTARLVE